MTDARYDRGSMHARLKFTLATMLMTLPFSSLTRADDPPAAQAAATNAPGALAPNGYSSGETTHARLTAFVQSANSEGRSRARIERIATSRRGTAIEVIVLGEQDSTKKQPAMLLVGGMDGVDLASTEQVLAALNTLQRDHAELLKTMRIYAIAEANPDARADAINSHTPRATNAREVDDDRDGAIDEDAPRDINGDGLITSMRRVAPAGRSATHVVDAADARITRAAKKDKGEVATHELFVEGLDIDGDGLLSEDALGGVALDHNFAHRYPEFAIDAGPYQMSEPEAMGIARFVRDHSDIVSAIVFGRHDTLVNFPDTKDKDSTSRTPMCYLAEDHDMYRAIAKLFKESTKLEKSDSADLAGSLVLWLANHRGIAAVAVNGWTRPVAPDLAEGAPAAVETGDADEAAWLAVSDRLYGGAGFDAWTTEQHPKLGVVEVGGFLPFFKSCPTIAQAETLAAATTPFVAKLAELTPRITVSDARLTPISNGLVRIDLRVTNTGTLATTTEMGRITQMIPPIVLRVIGNPSDVLSGKAIEKIERLEAGASNEYSWTVRVQDGASVDITVIGPTFDTITRTATPALSATQPGTEAPR